LNNIILQLGQDEEDENIEELQYFPKNKELKLVSNPPYL
jgi:hypothetical protein